MPPRKWKERCASRFRLLNNDTHIVWIDQIGDLPSIEVILLHALLGESLVLRRLSAVLCGQQRFKSNAFVIAEVVPFVKLVTSTELRPNGIPHQLHQLH